MAAWRLATVVFLVAVLFYVPWEPPGSGFLLR